MTDQQINEAIVRHMGWTCEAANPAEAIMCWVRPGGMAHQLEMRPDCCNDLNACHEMEKTLSPNQAKQMVEKLGDITDIAWRCSDYNGSWLRIHATARQRAEAFLKTVGKWEDGK